MAACLHLLKTRTLYLALILLLLSGCTPEKAKSVRLTAEQFSNQALVAINALDRTMTAELAPPPRSDTEAAQQFIAQLVELDLADIRSEGDDLGFPNLEHAAHPDAFDLDSTVQKARSQYLNNLRERYTRFAGMLEGLEEGSFFVSDALNRANEIAKRLTADMAVIAKHFSSHPPQLIQQRSQLVADTLDILEDSNLSKSAKEDRLALIKTRFDDLKTAEDQLLRDILEPTLKAAEMGSDLQKMIAGYDQLAVADMQNMLLQSIGIIGDLSGRDMSVLTNKANTVFAKISSDPVLQSVADQAMDEINKIPVAM